MILRIGSKLGLNRGALGTMTPTFGLWVLGALWLSEQLLITAYATPAFTFRTGLALAETGAACQSVFDLPLGYTFFTKLANSSAQLPAIVDRTGRVYGFNMDFVHAVPVACNATAHAQVGLAGACMRTNSPS